MLYVWLGSSITTIYFAVCVKAEHLVLGWRATSRATRVGSPGGQVRHLCLQLHVPLRVNRAQGLVVISLT